MDHMDNLGQRIKTARTLANLSQKEMADKLGVNQTTVARWETGKRMCDTESLRKIAEITNTRIHRFFEGDSQNPPTAVVPSATGPEYTIDILERLNGIKTIIENKDEYHRGLLSEILEKINCIIEKLPSPGVIPFPGKHLQEVQFIEQPVGAGKTLADGVPVGSLKVHSRGKPSFAFFVKGTSMEPDIPHGSLLLVRPAKLNWKNDDFCVVYLRETDEWTVKMARHDQTWSKIRLIGSGEDRVYNMEDVIVQGVVEDWVSDRDTINELLNSIIEFNDVNSGRLTNERESKDNNSLIKRKSEIGDSAYIFDPLKSGIIEPSIDEERMIRMEQGDDEVKKSLNVLIELMQQQVELARSQERRMAEVEKNMRETEKLVEKGLRLSEENTKLVKQNEVLASINYLLERGEISAEEAEYRIKKFGVNVNRFFS